MLEKVVQYVRRFFDPPGALRSYVYRERHTGRETLELNMIKRLMSSCVRPSDKVFMMNEIRILKRAIKIKRKKEGFNLKESKRKSVNKNVIKKKENEKWKLKKGKEKNHGTIPFSLDKIVKAFNAVKDEAECAKRGMWHDDMYDTDNATKGRKIATERVPVRTETRKMFADEFEVVCNFNDGTPFNCPKCIEMERKKRIVAYVERDVDKILNKREKKSYRLYEVMENKEMLSMIKGLASDSDSVANSKGKSVGGENGKMTAGQHMDEVVGDSSGAGKCDNREVFPSEVVQSNVKDDVIDVDNEKQQPQELFVPAAQGENMERQSVKEIVKRIDMVCESAAIAMAGDATSAISVLRKGAETEQTDGLDRTCASDPRSDVKIENVISLFHKSDETGDRSSTKTSSEVRVPWSIIPKDSNEDGGSVRCSLFSVRSNEKEKEATTKPSNKGVVQPDQEKTKPSWEWPCEIGAKERTIENPFKDIAIPNVFGGINQEFPAQSAKRSSGDDSLPSYRPINVDVNGIFQRPSEKNSDGGARSLFNVTSRSGSNTGYNKEDDDISNRFNRRRKRS